MTVEKPVEDPSARLDEILAHPSTVVFAGDGEPRRPEEMARRLARIASERGIRADSYSLGGAVADLEDRFARVLGKQSAVFMPTGTLANHLAVRGLCAGRPRAIVLEQSHLYHDSGDCVQRLSGINLVPVAPDRAHFTQEDAREAVARSSGGRVSSPVGALVVESPVRRQRGRVMPFDEMKRVASYCADVGIGTHLDGARLFMMSAATGISPAEYAALFDTVYVSLYKYLGAPFGAILAGSEEFCRDLYHERRMFGGGLPGSALAAALALDGLDGFEERFGQAMSRARALFSDLDTIPGLGVRAYENGSNIFRLELAPGADTRRLVRKLALALVFVSVDESDDSSIHLTVNTSVLRQTSEEIFRAFAGAVDGP